MKANEAFVGFDEDRIAFAPTYRYERGNRTYAAAKLRVPSYCDRILKRTLPGVSAIYESYDAVDTITSSDHSPVTATIRARLAHTIGLRSVDEISVDGGIAADVEPATQDEAEVGSREIQAVNREEVTCQQSSDEEEGEDDDAPVYEIEFLNLSASGLPEMDGVRQGAASMMARAVYGSINPPQRTASTDSSDDAPPDEGEGGDVAPGDGAGGSGNAPVGLCDAYIVFHGEGVEELESGEYSTDTVPESQEPTWAESTRIPLEDSLPALIRRRYIVLTVMDEDVGTADEVVGSTALWIGDGWVDDADSKSQVLAKSRFERDVMLAGKKRGTVRGDYVITRHLRSQ